MHAVSDANATENHRGIKDTKAAIPDRPVERPRHKLSRQRGYRAGDEHEAESLTRRLEGMFRRRLIATLAVIVYAL